MRARFVIVVVGLVILPTALLSLMAGRTISSLGYVLQNRISAGASATLDLVAAGVDSALDDDISYLRRAVADALHGGAREQQQIEHAIARVQEERMAVGDAYLFMSPWGFIYPDMDATGTVATNGSVAQLSDIVRAEVRHAIATRHSLDVDVRFRVGDKAYCFAALPDRKDLYVGYEVSVVMFRRILQKVAKAAAGEEFAVRASGEGFEITSGGLPPGRVVVSGKVGWEEMVSAKENGADVALAYGMLNPPFQNVRLEVFSQDPESMVRTTFIQMRLYGVAIVLLVVGIVVGTAYILWSSSTELKRARSRSAYVIGVSHDLRTPIAAMKVMAESLHAERVTDADRRKQFLQIILNECEHLQELTERVLFFVRFGQQALVYRKRPEDIGALVRETAESFHARYLARQSSSSRDKGVERPILSVRASNDLTAEVDAGAIRQVLLNLLDNATKYGMPSPGVERHPSDPPIKVVVSRWTGRRSRWRPKRTWIRIAVQDSGLGLSPTDCRRIFREFYRGRASTQMNLSGVGLGLALSKHVVRGHGGVIEAVSGPGGGTTFVVMLPYRPA